MHPVVLQAMEHDDADDRTLNELFGCFARCAAYIANYEGDYVIRLGAFKTIAGMSRWSALEAQGVAAGYVTRVQLEDGSPALKLVEDEDLFNMIPRSAREWTNQRKADARNTKLTVPVRLRDGDGCRYCGDIVIWGDQKSRRGATYDHRKAGQPGTVDTIVVACRECNSTRLKAREEFDRQHPLLPEPKDPYYSRSTASWLAKHGRHVTPSDGSRKTSPAGQAYGTASAVPDPEPVVASGQAYGTEVPAASESVPATAVEHTDDAGTTVPDPEPSQAPEEHTTQPQDETPSHRVPPDSGQFRRIPANPRSTGSGFVGSGPGTGRASPGQDGSGQGRRRASVPPEPSDPSPPQENYAQSSPRGDGSKKRRRRRKRCR